MKLRKTLVSILAVLMIMATMPMSVFAATAENAFLEEIESLNGGVGVLSVANEYCKELGNIESPKLIVGAPGDAPVVIPLEKDEENLGAATWVGTPSDRVSPYTLSAMADVQGDIDLKAIFDELMSDFDEEDFAAEVKSGKSEKAAADVIQKIYTLFEGSETGDSKLVRDIESQLENFGKDFTVTVEGLPDAHYTVEDTRAFVITTAMIAEACDITFDFLNELLDELAAEVEYKGDVAQVSTISDFIDEICKIAEMDREEIVEAFDEIIAEQGIEDMDGEKFIAQLDDALAFLKTEFEGLLIASAFVDCDCPVMVEYEIAHMYFENVNGSMEFRDIEWDGEALYGEEYGYYLLGEKGDVIKAEDYIKTNHGGKEYEYVGSYDSFTTFDFIYELEDEFDAEYYAEDKLDSFELGDEDITGLALVYVVDGDSDGPITDPDDSGDPEDNTVDVVKEMSSDTGEMSPDTGDTTPIALYAGLFTGAVALMAVLAVKRRKNSR